MNGYLKPTMILMLALLHISCENPTGVSDLIGPIPVIATNDHYSDTTEFPTGSYAIDSAWINGGMLYLNLRCAAQEIAAFKLLAWNSHVDSWPPVYMTKLSYRAATDSSAWRQYRLLSNLTPMVEMYREYCRDYNITFDLADESVLRIMFEGTSVDLWYDF